MLWCCRRAGRLNCAGLAAEAEPSVLSMAARSFWWGLAFAAAASLHHVAHHERSESPHILPQSDVSALHLDRLCPVSVACEGL